ncbi:tripartite tricarboxylate transporter substrate binding protein [Pigmentiphaga soli]|uniref:Bug family tripartite tricarboxylate transporter substrate binding protein n=1 Tax=Pigmentiphaga soli TaxID=1007095 RepID=UPI0031ED9702
MLALSWSPACLSQAYPGRPLKLVVPFEAGGGTDILARQIASALGERLRQSVIVENRGGAGAILGTEAVAKAEPDGYTLLLGQIGPLAINPSLYAKLPYDPIRDFEPVILLGAQPLVLVVNPEVRAGSVSELVALAKAQPNRLNFSSAGEGSMGHLAGELFKLLTGAPIVHIPYKSGAPAVHDVMGGHVQMTFNVVPGVSAGIKSGKLRPIAASGPVDTLPGVPTMSAAGVPEFDAVSWFGILLPAKTPASIAERLNRELNAVIDSPGIRELMSRQDVRMLGGSPAAFTAYLKKETDRWARVIRNAGVQAAQ